MGLSVHGLTLALYVASSGFALVTALSDRIPLQRSWGSQALPVYVIAALLTCGVWAFRSRITWRTRTFLTWTIAGFVLLGATLLPLARFVVARGETTSVPTIQSEALMVEEGAIALVDGSDPYAVSFERTPIGRWPAGTELHYPYPPGSLLFGLPRALVGGSPLTDARAFMLLFDVGVVLLALAILRPSQQGTIVIVLGLFALPSAARYIVGAGTDIPAIALMLLSLGLFARGRACGAGLAAGLAVCVKHLALPLLPCLVVGVLMRHGRRAAGRMVLAMSLPMMTIVPFLVWSPADFVDDVIRFPLGLSRDDTIARSPTVGRALAAVVPVPRSVLAAGLLLLVIVTTVALSFRRLGRPSPAMVANTTALVTGLLVVMATAGRWGYLIYPLNLLLWARFAFEPRRQGADLALPRHDAGPTRPWDVPSPDHVVSNPAARGSRNERAPTSPASRSTQTQAASRA
jgi:hypothetical protein